MGRRPKGWGAALAAALFAGAAATASRAGPPPPERAWEVEVGPYLWGQWIDGDLTVRSVSTEVEASPADIVRHLNLGAMGFAQVRWKRLVAVADGLWAVLEGDGERRRVEADAELEQAIVDLKLGVRVLDLPAPWSEAGEREARRVAFDVLAGARWWYLKTELDVEVAGVRSRSVEKSTDWVDPVVGARLRLDLTERLSLGVLGDVGGFGWGTASDSTWNAGATLNWRASEHWILHAGYKALEIEREHGSRPLEAEILFQGPVIGVGYRF
jgi:hypothetical protein